MLKNLMLTKFILLFIYFSNLQALADVFPHPYFGLVDTSLDELFPIDRWEETFDTGSIKTDQIGIFGGSKAVLLWEKIQRRNLSKAWLNFSLPHGNRVGHFTAFAHYFYIVDFVINVDDESEFEPGPFPFLPLSYPKDSKDYFTPGKYRQVFPPNKLYALLDWVEKKIFEPSHFHPPIFYDGPSISLDKIREMKFIQWKKYIRLGVILAQANHIPIQNYLVTIKENKKFWQKKLKKFPVIVVDSVEEIVSHLTTFKTYTK